MGNSESDAIEASEVLAMTDLRGVETHGVSNMLRAYVSQYTSGQVNPTPNWRIERETPRHGRHQRRQRTWRRSRQARYGHRNREGAQRWHGHRNHEQRRTPRRGRSLLHVRRPARHGRNVRHLSRQRRPPHIRARKGASARTPSPSPRPPTRKPPCSSTPPHPRLPATSSPWLAESAQTCSPAGFPTKRATQ